MAVSKFKRFSKSTFTSYILVCMVVVFGMKSSFSSYKNGKQSKEKFSDVINKETTDNSATFPLIQLRIDPNDPNKLINLPEENDGVKHIEKSNTWEGDRLVVMIEFDEWMLANAFVEEGDVVIEFGARFGTTSCILSRNVGDSGHVIAVEPDVNVHGYLMRNQYNHRCSFFAVFGTVSKTPMYMKIDDQHYSYAAQTSTVEIKGTNPLPNIDVATIERSIGRRINVALIDCEGCIPSVYETGLLDKETGVDVILMEEDAIDYNEWHEKLFKQGYMCVWYTKDTSYPNKAWSRNMRHSAWIHKRVEKERTFKSCKEYVKSKGYTSGQIICTECPVVVSN